MNILVLGSTGMLGHKLLQTLGESHSVTGTVRNKSNAYESSHFRRFQSNWRDPCR